MLRPKKPMPLQTWQGVYEERYTFWMRRFNDTLMAQTNARIDANQQAWIKVEISPGLQTQSHGRGTRDKDHYKNILLRFVKPGDAVYTVTLKHSRTSYSRHTMLLVVNSQGDIENITVPVARFLNERISNSTGGIITNEQSELISYLAIKLFDSSTALTQRKL